MIESSAATQPLIGRRPLGSGLHLGVSGTDAPERAELESFVGAAFKRGHDATVTSFMPTHRLAARDRA